MENLEYGFDLSNFFLDYFYALKSLLFSIPKMRSRYFERKEMI
jgi:hypothetical protein